jgi:PA14 domain
MSRQFALKRALCFLAALVGVGVFTCSTWAQQTPPTLPSGWQQLSPTDFAALLRNLQSTDQFDSLSDANRSALVAQGLQFFSQVNIANTALNYETLEMLQWVSRYSLPQPLTDQAKKALLARHDNWSGQSYAEVRAKAMLMLNLGLPAPLAFNEGRQWIQAGGTLAQVPQSDLIYDFVRQGMSSPQFVTGSLSVQWNGFVTAPQTGNYTFLISPINVNVSSGTQSVQVSMSVAVGGQTILNATPTNWVAQSNAVGLTAGQAVAIQVNYTANQAAIPAGALHALLSWQGPDIPQSIVPTSSLSQSSGAAGLAATYTWSRRGQTQSLTRTDSTVDFAWTNSPILLTQDMTIGNQAADAMWQYMSSPTFLSTLPGPPRLLHAFLVKPNEVASGLTSARRQAFSSILVQNPALLDAADAKHIVRYYEPFRIGATDAALDVFGTWAARKANIASEISIDRAFDGDDRDAFRLMSLYTTQQLPTEWRRLQSQYLQLPDGSCSLPVAYTLGISHLQRGKLSSWIALLNSELTNASITGDLRVNWLIARSFVEEIRQSPAVPGAQIVCRALDGRPFLDAANQAAQSPPVKARVLKEIAARLVWSGDFQGATNLLQQASPSLPSAQQTLVAAWQQEIDAIAAAAAQNLQTQAAESKQAYIAALQQRRDKAATQGNTALVDHYNSLLSAVQNSGQ